MRSERLLRVALLVAAATGGCAAPAVVVTIDNPEQLPIAHERVRADWSGDGGATRSTTHDFAVNGNLGTFAIERAHIGRGRLRVSVELDDAAGVEVGRATGTIVLGNQTRTDLRLRATRLLSHPHATLLAGLPGGRGDRDGPTGGDPLLPARLDEPLAFTSIGPVNVNGAVGLVLEACGAIRRVRPQVGAANAVDLILPCSRHTPPSASGAFVDLSLDDPATLLGDPYGPTVYIADGARVLAVAYPAIDSDPATLTYYDFTAASGMAPMHIADLALGPYHAREAGATPYDTLYVADDVANVVWAYPIAGGAPTIAVGQLGACLTPLPAIETAHPPSGGGAWSPGPYVAPSSAHLCRPTRLDTGAISGVGSDPVLFVGDAGHGNVRMATPHGLGGAPGVTTLFDGLSGFQAFGYRFLGSNVVLAGTEVGAMFFWTENRLSYFLLYSNPTLSGNGTTSPIAVGAWPGYTDRFNFLTALGAAAMGKPLDVRFDDVTHTFRVTDNAQADAVVSRSFMMFAERGSSVIKSVDLDLDVIPWIGAGPHIGVETVGGDTAAQALFAAPAGLAWNGSDTLYVADRGNDAVAAVRYDDSATPIKGVQSAPLVGCPRTGGHVDGPATQALLRRPRAVAFDAAHTALFILDADGTSVRRAALGADGVPLEVHTLFAADGDDGTRWAADGGPLPPADVGDGGVAPAGLLGTASAMVFDEARRALWLAHADSADLVMVDVDDDTSTPKLVALPDGATAGQRLAIVDATLFAVGTGGQLTGIDLLADSPVAAPLPALALPGAVTAAGSDGEWLYVADDSARVWRVDPIDLSAPPTLLFGDGAHGLVLGDNPGVNRVGGFAYDGARGILMVSDSVESSLVAIQ